MDDPNSIVYRIHHGARETAKHLLTVDDLIVYRTQDGGITLEAVRWSKDKRALESYRFHLCPEDTTRLKTELRLQS